MNFQRLPLAVLAVAAAIGTSSPALADSLSAALAQAYNNNPTLNAARASLRATDEGVPQALGGYRPTVSGTASIGRSQIGSYAGSYGITPRSVGITIQQPIFKGFRTQNGVKAAESAVLAGRETLRDTEQTVLLDAVTAYMNVIEYQAIVGLRQQNITFLREQYRAAQDRLKVGEGTRTDVAQTEASLSSGQSSLQVAVANLNAANAAYVQVIGVKPRNLATPPVNSRTLPRSADATVQVGLAQHPSILSASYNVDTAESNVKIIEGSLLPTVTLDGSVAHNDDSSSPDTWSNSASITANLSVPIYEGGVVYSEVRQAKETLGQRRIELDSARDSVRASAISAFGNLQAAQATIMSSNSGVRAAQLALEGVIEEQKVGQQTTLDVLNQQQTLLTAREALVAAQHDQVVAAYSVVSAMGNLTSDKLGLSVSKYKPEQHYQAVRDKWIGLRTPDGR